MRFLTRFLIACGVVGFAAKMPTAQTQNQPKVSDAIHQLFVENGEDMRNADWAAAVVREAISSRPKSVAAGSPAPFLTGRTLAPYDEQFLPDSARLDFCVPALVQQKQNVAMFNAGKRPTETMTAPGCKRY